MSLFVTQQNIPFQAVSRYLRYFAPAHEGPVAEWVTTHARDICPGDIIFVFEPIFSPWGDSASGIGVADGDSFKVEQALFTFRFDAGGVQAYAVTPELYQLTSVAAFLEQRARSAAESASGFYYALVRSSTSFTPEQLQALSQLNRYGDSGKRVEIPGLPDFPVAFCETVGFPLAAAAKQKLDASGLGHSLFCDKAPSAGGHIPDLRACLLPVSMDEGRDSISGAADAATAADPRSTGGSIPRLPSFFAQMKPGVQSPSDTEGGTRVVVPPAPPVQLPPPAPIQESVPEHSVDPDATTVELGETTADLTKALAQSVQPELTGSVQSDDVDVDTVSFPTLGAAATAAPPSVPAAPGRLPVKSPIKVPPPVKVPGTQSATAGLAAPSANSDNSRSASIKTTRSSIVARQNPPSVGKSGSVPPLPGLKSDESSAADEPAMEVPPAPATPGAGKPVTLPPAPATPGAGKPVTLPPAPATPGAGKPVTLPSAPATPGAGKPVTLPPAPATPGAGKPVTLPPAPATPGAGKPVTLPPAPATPGAGKPVTLPPAPATPGAGKPIAPGASETGSGKASVSPETTLKTPAAEKIGRPGSSDTPKVELSAAEPPLPDLVSLLAAATASKESIPASKDSIAVVDKSVAEPDKSSLKDEPAAEAELLVTADEKAAAVDPDEDRALKEPVPVKSGVAGLVAKLEQQAAKASARLETQVEDIQNRLNEDLAELLGKVNAGELRSAKTADDLRKTLSAGLQAAGEEVKSGISHAAEDGADEIGKHRQSGITALDEKQAALKSELTESFADISRRAEQIASEFDLAMRDKTQMIAAELQDLRQRLNAQFDQVQEQYESALQKAFDAYCQRSQESNKAIASALESRFAYLHGELLDLQGRSMSQLEQTKEQMLNRLNKQFEVAQAEFGKLQATLLSENIMPRLKQHREELRVVTGEFQLKLTRDLEAKSAAKVMEFDPAFQEQKRKLDALLEDTASIKDKTQGQLSDRLDEICSALVQFVDESMESAKAAYKNTEEQLAEIDRSVRGLADPASIESDTKLRQDRNDVLATMGQSTESCRNDVLNTLRASVAGLEETGKQLQEELISSMEEDAYVVRRASEQALVTIKEELKASFVAIQTAQDERMPM